MGGIFDVSGKEARAAELEEQTLANEFWQDQEKAQAVLKERATLLGSIQEWKKHDRAAADDARRRGRGLCRRSPYLKRRTNRPGHRHDIQFRFAANLVRGLRVALGNLD